MEVNGHDLPTLGGRGLYQKVGTMGAMKELSTMVSFIEMSIRAQIYFADNWFQGLEPFSHELTFILRATFKGQLC